jgi:hypothetical protein
LGRLLDVPPQFVTDTLQGGSTTVGDRSGENPVKIEPFVCLVIWASKEAFGSGLRAEFLNEIPFSLPDSATGRIKTKNFFVASRYFEWASHRKVHLATSPGKILLRKGNLTRKFAISILR